VRRLTELSSAITLIHFFFLRRYSFYNAKLLKWVSCQEMNSNGTAVSVGSQTEAATEIVRCPLAPSAEPRPIIIRVEKTFKTAFAVALPVGGGGRVETSYAYFSVFVNATVPVDDVPDGVDDGSVPTIIAAALAVVLVLLIIILVAIIARKKAKNASKVPTFYADLPMSERGDGSEYTATTSAGGGIYSRLGSIDASDVLGLFSADELYAAKSAPDRSKLGLILRRQLSGDPARLNPTKALNHQAGALSYDARLEVDRSRFTVGKMLGAGHFGAVYEGKAEGLLHAGSETRVAVKTTADALELSQLAALICEMKVMAQLDLHAGLVNLLGCCTTEIEEGRLWLLLEFCEHGDLKSFLVANRDRLKNAMAGAVADDMIDSRLFIRWFYHVAKGMEYLHSKKIMHGDLAARNVLLSDSLNAKIGDFGLSKSLYYDNARYKKTRRPYVPWKWMAPEYLADGVLTLRSDVWSYGIVLWEIMSLGREPYAGKTYEETSKEIRNGLRLEMPEEVTSIRGLDWPQTIFDKVVQPAWAAEPPNRADFSTLTLVLADMMCPSELAEYSAVAAAADGARRLMFDETSRALSKRDTLSPTTSDATERASSAFDANRPPGSYQRASVQQQPHPAATGGYVAVSTLQNTSQQVEPEHSSGYVSAGEANNVTLREDQGPGGSSGYMTMSSRESAASQNEEADSSAPPAGYVAVSAAKAMEGPRAVDVSS